MGLFSKLFGKDKKKEDKKSTVAADPQEQYMKKEVKAAPTKKEPAAEEKKQEAAVKKTAKPKNEAEPAKAEKPAAKADVLKEEEPKKPAAAKKSATSQKAAEPKKAAESTKPAAVKNPADTAKEEKAEEAVTPETVEDVATETVTESKVTRNGSFEVKRAKDGRYFFTLYASNRAAIASSQIYSSSQSAMNGIKSVIANAPKAPIEDTTLKNPTAQPFPKWEIYIDKAGQHRFRLYATNGSCVCHSHGYASKATCKGGIESIIRFSAEAEITKMYLK